LSESKTQSQRKDSFALNYGDTVLYCGRQYRIAPSMSGKIGVSSDCFFIPAGLLPECIKSACIQIYRILAKSDLTLKVNNYSAQMGVTAASVKINGANTRWGSCSAKKSLNFSWRLIMADNDVIDYVVVHELAHIIEMNHSPRFWAVVERVLPDYREQQAKLKELQKKLILLSF
ncbi:MAG: M48 family metallopeptidase, partial [Oscillospiraceae bacterium]|nr:M48 family metallopeptidase [Oscillospiraceae bacterium]